MRHIITMWVCAVLAACSTLPTIPATQPTRSGLSDTPIPAPDIEPSTIPIPTPVPTPAVLQAVPTGGELLVLSAGDLVGIAVTDSRRRTILAGVSAFAAAPDGMVIAAIRGSGAAGELWTVRRDGSDAQQHTDDPRSLASLHWLPDSSGYVYAASDSDSAQQTSWLEWAAFCRTATIVRRSLNDRKEYPIGEGCDPVVSPDGKRIAYATRPSRSDTSAADPGNTAGNAIHLINMAGENGWDPVTASGAEPGQAGQGLVVYQPFWTADSKNLFVSVFVGNRVETDVNLLTLVDASAGTSQLLGTSAGWNRSLSRTNDGASYILTTQNTGNARGVVGWDVWQTAVFTLTGTRDIYLPDGTFSALGIPVGESLVRGQFSASHPGSNDRIVVMPPDWQPGITPNEEYGHTGEPGDLWLWPIGGMPSTKISTPIDSASPVQWLP